VEGQEIVGKTRPNFVITGCIGGRTRLVRKTVALSPNAVQVLEISGQNCSPPTATGAVGNKGENFLQSWVMKATAEESGAARCARVKTALSYFAVMLAQKQLQIELAARIGLDFEIPDSV